MMTNLCHPVVNQQELNVFTLVIFGWQIWTIQSSNDYVNRELPRLT